ncbi:MAG TPA: 50S ribosomal protein L22 [Bacteroidales bacterium]|nr:50S ribosomal protein L22 [Bacteroidales bacterium]HRZ49710.1 50S ribosomal protein L22 [Bacteroidales bacterium]
MGARKRIAAEERKEANKSLYFAKLNDCPSSPRKMRLVADMIRGMEVEKALYVLKTSPKDASDKVRKLVLSAMANWQQKNQGARMEDSHLYVKTIQVDGGRMLKRLQTAPQGRAHRVRKRSNHVTVFLGSRKEEEEALLAMQEEVKEETEN